jgi:uncharacterized membrane protein YgcG
MGRLLYTVAGCTALSRDLCRRQKHNVLTKEKFCMRCLGILLFLVVIACIFLAGCTQSSGTGPVATVVPVTTPPSTEPATLSRTAVETAVPTAAVTSAPQQVVTIIHQIPLIKDVKDSELLFSLQVPVEWNLSTRRLNNPENFEGYMYQTDLVRNNTFYIHSFTNYRSRDQNYRDECRRWSPAPNETTVTINGITFDRFESTANGTTNVTYVARQVCMNEYGYVSVLAFSANTSNRFEEEDYDRIVASFRYYGREFVSTMPGEEITKIAAPKGEAGNMRSASGSGSSGSSGGSSTGGSSSGGGCSRR